MKEVRAGLYHWTALHPRIRQQVSSYLVEPSRTLIDPMLPPDGGLERFRGREPERIVLTNRHHYRDSGAFVREFGCPVLCNEAGLHEFEDGPEVEGFSFGEELTEGIVALEVGAICPEETALHIAVGDGALSLADGLIRYRGELRFVPDELLGDDPEPVKRELRDAFSRLLDRDFDCLLLAHGEPLVGGGKDALRAFVAEPPGPEPFDA